MCALVTSFLRRVSAVSCPAPHPPPSMVGPPHFSGYVLAIRLFVVCSGGAGVCEMCPGVPCPGAYIACTSSGVSLQLFVVVTIEAVASPWHRRSCLVSNHIPVLGLRL